MIIFVKFKLLFVFVHRTHHTSDVKTHRVGGAVAEAEGRGGQDEEAHQGEAGQGGGQLEADQTVLVKLQ